MGNSPLTACISQAWEKQTVQVVLPDGQVMFMPHPLTVKMLMEAHPNHFVCQGSPSILEQRLPIDRKLESGEIYYLLPFPPPVVTTTPTRGFFQNNSSQQQHFSRGKQFPEKIPYKPQPPSAEPMFDKSTSQPSFPDYARLNLKPQRCLINLFVFRQSVASIMPEESFKPASQAQGDTYYQCSNKSRIAPPASPPPVLSNRTFSPKVDQPQKQQQLRGSRGRKQAAPWKPHLESISETKPVLHDFSSTITTDKNSYINDFSVSITSGTKPFVSSPYPSPPSSPLHNLLFPLHSYKGQHHQQQVFVQQRSGAVIHSPQHHKQQFFVQQCSGAVIHSPQHHQQQFFVQQRSGAVIHSPQHHQQQVFVQQRSGAVIQSPQHHQQRLFVQQRSGAVIQSPQHHKQQFFVQQRSGAVIHSPLHGDRDGHRQRFIYSA